MTKGVKGSPYPRDVRRAAETLEITKQIPAPQLAAMMRRKGPVEVMLGKISIQRLPQLNAHWHQSVLVALADDPKEKIIQIDISAAKAEQLIYPKASIKGRQRRM